MARFGSPLCNLSRERHCGHFFVTSFRREAQFWSPLFWGGVKSRRHLGHLFVTSFSRLSDLFVKAAFFSRTRFLVVTFFGDHIFLRQGQLFFYDNMFLTLWMFGAHGEDIPSGILAHGGNSLVRRRERCFATGMRVRSVVNTHPDILRLRSGVHVLTILTQRRPQVPFQRRLPDTSSLTSQASHGVNTIRGRGADT